MNMEIGAFPHVSTSTKTWAALRGSGWEAYEIKRSVFLITLINISTYKSTSCSRSTNLSISFGDCYFIVSILTFTMIIVLQSFIIAKMMINFK